MGESVIQRSRGKCGDRTTTTVHHQYVTPDSRTAITIGNQPAEVDTVQLPRARSCLFHPGGPSRRTIKPLGKIMGKTVACIRTMVS